MHLQIETFALALLVAIVALSCVPLLTYMRLEETQDCDRCDDGNVCTSNTYIAAQDYCANHPLPSTTACTSVCHIEDATTAYCDPKTVGCVVSDPTECRGYCAREEDFSNYNDGYVNSTCTSLFPFVDALVNPNSSWWLNEKGYILTGTDASFCYLDECSSVLWVLHPGPPNFWPWNGGDEFGCAGYLALDEDDPRRGCIDITTFDLPTAVYIQQLTGDAADDNSTQYHARLCTYRYACGRTNYSGITEWLDTYTPGWNGTEVTALGVAAAADPSGLLGPMSQTLGQTLFPASRARRGGSAGTTANKNVELTKVAFADLAMKRLRAGLANRVKKR